MMGWFSVKEEDVSRNVSIISSTIDEFGDHKLDSINYKK